jgi:hypothetical protein
MNWRYKLLARADAVSGSAKARGDSDSAFPKQTAIHD